MIHHFAIAPRDFTVSHRFYTEVMGFRLVKAVKRQALGGPANGWTKHVFYDTGQGSLFALWDLHLTDVDEARGVSMSVDLGLPWWINHIAFDVQTLDELEERKLHWLSCGLKVSEVDHDFIRSIYAKDPDGNMVEFTCPTRDLDDADIAEALEILADDAPAELPEYPGTVYFPDGRVITV